MGYWTNTTYLNHGNTAEIEQSLIASFETEGMKLIPAPPPRERAIAEPMHYAPALENVMWGVAVFPGASGWTIIQTAPLELLAERAAGAPRMRLAGLCKRMECSGFHLAVYDSLGAVLAEASSRGEIVVSGINLGMVAADPHAWQGESLAEDLCDPQFQLHASLRDLLGPDAGHEEQAKAIAARLGGENAAFCDNGVSVDTLISHKPFTAVNGTALYFRRSD